MKVLYLDHFIRVSSNEKESASIQTSTSGSFISLSNHTIPVNKDNLIANLVVENGNEVEVEVEIDELQSIACLFPYSNNFKCFLSNVFTVPSKLFLKVEFLDVFSPPPNF